MNQGLTGLVKVLSKKAIARQELVNAVGTTGNLGLTIRANRILKALLMQRLAACEKTLPAVSIDDVRQRTLRYVERMRIKNGQYGLYSYSASSPRPTLYSTAYACLLRHLYGDLDGLSEEQRREWVNYIKEHQADDGLFKDPLVSNRLADSADWWGWRHLTLHVVMALTALGTPAPKKLRFLERFHDPDYAVKWLKTRDWGGNVANVSNELQNHMALLQYARDLQGEEWADSACKKMLECLYAMQDSKTGLWGDRFDRLGLLSNGVQAGYHIWNLYFYSQLRIAYPGQVIDSCLRTQNTLGGFGPFLNSSACEDIDSIDPLARLHARTSYKEQQIRAAMSRALVWVLSNMNEDGGFVFRRYEPFIYGHENMFSGPNESAMFPTWFRTLSLAYLAKTLPNSLPGKFCWEFLECPGYQFWR